jgi:hypothetical protein
MQPSQLIWRIVLGELAGPVAQPIAGVLDHIELAVGIGDLAVAAGLLVVAGAKHRAVILAT